MTYLDMVNDFANSPRDIHTVPITKRQEIWFYAYVEDGILYVKSAKEHRPSCNISSPRKINPEHFDRMKKIYHRRCHGEKVSEEAKKITVCQVYWYGIFKELGI